MRFKVTYRAARPNNPRNSTTHLLLILPKNLCSFHVERDLLTETYYFGGARVFFDRPSSADSSISIMRWVAVRFSKLS